MIDNVIELLDALDSSSIGASMDEFFSSIWFKIGVAFLCLSIVSAIAGGIMSIIALNMAMLLYA